MPKLLVTEVLPGQLSWSPEAKGGSVTPALSFCQYGAKKGSRCGEYQVMHYQRSQLGRAFGPLSLESLLRFCRGLEAQLASKPLTSHPLMLGTPPGDWARLANASVLLGAYLILCHNWTVQRLTKTLSRGEADLSFACSWASVEAPEPVHVQTVKHCWQGIFLAKQHGWINGSFARDDAAMEKACQNYNSMLALYDACWIIPGKLMVGADPTTVIHDRSPITCSRLYPKEDEANTPYTSADGSAYTASTCEPTDSDTDSVNTVCRPAYDAYSPKDVSSGDATSAADASFVGFLRQSGVSLVMRANYGDEEGMPLDKYGYTDTALEPYGITQASVCINDTRGSMPKPGDIARMLRACEGFMQNDRDDAVMFHCKGGFGRSVVLACCLAICRYDIPGSALMGWLRIVRPGAFTVRSQEAFMESLRGRNDVYRFARVPVVDDKESVGVKMSCSAPCHIQ